ncbi:uncharacterized protein LOC119591709 [Penaeus monodon]|uniref:uncharacterized protein LOC119591709 n=1 Tax=Penaeus monodon TaxID=6687 RepID=UPI0018A7A950|nr:uncharacterized protein LOC119591709 [Penaeus monodon]
MATYAFPAGHHQAYANMAAPGVLGAYPGYVGPPPQGHYSGMGQMGADVDLDVDRAEFDRYLSGPGQQLPGMAWAAHPPPPCPQARLEYKQEPQEQYREVAPPGHQAFPDEAFRMPFRCDPLAQYRGDGGQPPYARLDFRGERADYPDEEYPHPEERMGAAYPHQQYGRASERQQDYLGGEQQQQGYRGADEYPGEMYRGEGSTPEYPGEPHRGSVGGTLLSALAHIRNMYFET